MIATARLIKTEHQDGSHEYSLDGFPIPSVSSVIEGAGFKPPAPTDPRILEQYHRKGRIGTALHASAELWEQDDLDEHTIDSAVFPYLQCFIDFLTEKEPELVSSEEMGFCEDLYVAGQWDRKYRMAGDLWRLDLKCAAQKASWWSVQLGLYDLIDEPTRRAALWLRPKARRKYELIEYGEDSLVDAVTCARAYAYRVRNKLVEGIVRPKEAA